MAILGIDPGLKGGLALVGTEGIIIEPMPTIEGHLHLHAIVRWLTAHRSEIEMAYLEKVSAMPGQGVSSMFKFGEGFGAIQGILTCMGVPFELVPPQKWMKVLHAGVDGSLESKARSKLAASRLFPTIDFRPTERSKVPHDGMVEAALIASYGLRMKAGNA